MFFFFFVEDAVKRAVKKGDTVYCVVENYYYARNTGPVCLEYIIAKGIVDGIILRKHKEVRICAVIDHKMKLYYFRMSALGKRFFFDYEDAVQEAIRETDRYEQTWEWMGTKLRRLWEDQHMKNRCVHRVGELGRNKTGEIIAHCTRTKRQMNVTRRECLGNCEYQERGEL